MKYVNLVYEDELSYKLLLAIIKQGNFPLLICNDYPGRGNGFIKRTICGFNHAAKGMPYIILTDLDNYQCPIALINEWLPQNKHSDLIFRIAVREAEAWLLADMEGLSTFLGIDIILIPQNSEELSDPKRALISLANRSPKKKIREDIVPLPGSTSIYGMDYNFRLGEFLEKIWSLHRAKNRCPSLARAVRAIEALSRR